MRSSCGSIALVLHVAAPCVAQVMASRKHLRNPGFCDFIVRHLHKWGSISIASGAGYGAVTKTAKVKAGSTVAVFGLGVIGLAVIEVCRADISLLRRNPYVPSYVSVI